MNRRIVTILAIGTSFTFACGRPHLIATVSPMQANVRPGGTVVLTGDQSGFTKGPLMEWWIRESKLANPKNNCGVFGYVPKDFTGCPFGFVVYRTESSFPGMAVYYAPPTPGVYHVTVGIVQAGDWSLLSERIATAEIIVAQ